jgi:hypothetical protein
MVAGQKNEIWGVEGRTPRTRKNFDSVDGTVGVGQRLRPFSMSVFCRDAIAIVSMQSRCRLKLILLIKAFSWKECNKYLAPASAFLGLAGKPLSHHQPITPTFVAPTLNNSSRLTSIRPHRHHDNAPAAVPGQLPRIWRPHCRSDDRSIGMLLQSIVARGLFTHSSGLVVGSPRRHVCHPHHTLGQTTRQVLDPRPRPRRGCPRIRCSRVSI